VGAYQKDERSVIAQRHATISDFLLPSEEMQKGLLLTFLVPLHNSLSRDA
jgi:hypothetical protein